MAEKAFGIFYLDANKGYFYGSNSSSVLQVEIPADTMSYFDIINRDKFYQIIQALVTTHKIAPAPLLILVSAGATYEKNIASKTTEEINTESAQFLETVPFEKVLSRIYKMGDTATLFATNRDLYEAVKHGFEKLHFSTAAIVSLAVLQKVMPDLGSTLNLEAVASKFDAIKQYSFITAEEINNPAKPRVEQEEKPKSNPMRLYGLIGVFVVLVGVLVVMVIVTMQPPKPTPVVRQLPPVVNAPTPTPMPIITGTKEGSVSGQIISPTPRPVISPTELRK